MTRPVLPAVAPQRGGTTDPSKMRVLVDALLAEAKKQPAIQPATQTRR